MSLAQLQSTVTNHGAAPRPHGMGHCCAALGPVREGVGIVPSTVPGWTHRLKISESWQLEQWKLRTCAKDWPDVLDLYESAAYLRVSYNTVRAACMKDRNGKAQLRHQRIGTSYRIRRMNLDALGAVPDRAMS